MNKQVEDFIKEQKELQQQRYQLKKEEILHQIQLGEIVYEEGPSHNPVEFPYYEPNTQNYYKFIPVEISDDEYEELLKYVDKKDIEKVEKKVNPTEKTSGWYYFGCIIIVLGIVAAVAIIGSDDDLWYYGVICLFSSLFSAAPIILLSRIEQHLRTLTNLSK